MSMYDVVVIGSGPGGYVCAIRAAQLGLKTAVVEQQWMGGVCLNVGCIPTKALLKNAELVHTLRERGKEFGFSYEKFEFDYSIAVSRSRSVSERLTRGVGFLMKKNNIDVFMGKAKLISKNTVQINNQDNVQELEAKNIVIASGAHPSSIPGVDIDGEKIISYLEAIVQTTIPSSVVIIGAGAIGVEFATIWNSYGSQVTLVEMLPHVVPLEDEDVSKELEKAFKKRGMQILTGHRVNSIEKNENGVMVKVSGENGEKSIKAHQALVAIGFKPNTTDLGLEEVGVHLDQRGFITIDDKMATNIPGIWAIGDVTGKLLLAHVASAMGIVCSENIAGIESMVLEYSKMPRATYTHPQVASFGWTESQAKENGYEVNVGQFPFLANGKALGLGESSGFIKVVVDKKYGEVLGAHMIGPDVSELLPELTLAAHSELTIADIAHNVHAHPTLSEAIMEAAHAAGGKPIHT